jgi:hypothetical protein
MKRKFTGFMPRALALCLVLTLSGTLQLHAAKVVIKAKAVRPDVEHPVYVYKMEVPVANRDAAVNRCASILAATGYPSFSRELIKPVENRLVITGKDIEANISRNGTDFFYSNIPALKLTGKTGSLYSNDQALRAATNYLKKSGLMPKNEQEMIVDHVGGIMQMLSNMKGPEKKAVVVYFGREMDGLKVRNFGSSITVTYGDSDIPAGVQYHWREVASKSKVDSRAYVSSANINRSITEDINRVFGKDVTITIDKIDLVLYDNGGNYIQPAWVYQGISKSGREGIEDMPVLGYVPALTKVYEPIHHPAYSPEMKMPVNRMEKPPRDKDE